MRKAIQKKIEAQGYQILSVKKTTHFRVEVVGESGVPVTVSVSSSPANIDDEAKFVLQRIKQAEKRKKK